MYCATSPLQRTLLLFLCGSCLLVIGTVAVKSKFVCQGERLRLRCEGDYILRIYGAKYGRLEPGSAICPHENITDLNCQAPNVLLRMALKCSNKPRCTVRADSRVFGDPCPGTFKYLDVIYGCVPGDTWTPAPTSETKHQTNQSTRGTAISVTPKKSQSTSTVFTTEKLKTTQNNSIENANKTTGPNITKIYPPTIKSISQRFSTSTTTPGKPAPKAPKSKASGKRGEEWAIIALLRSLYLTYWLMKDNPRDTLVVFLSGVAGATVLLLLFLLAIRLCKKQRRKKKFYVETKTTDAGEEDEGNKIKSVTIELQGSDDETKEINVNPGDIIIIDHNDVDRPGSEDLGYLSEIVRFYNSQNIGSDDQISIRKQFSICDSPSVISTEASESRDSKNDSVGMKQCTCQHGSLLRPSSPIGII